MSILLGSIDLDGSIASSGNLTFSNTSSAVVQNVRTITPNGTSSFNGSSNTTATLDYGINIISIATSSNYCVKFPQPTTGKSVTVINKSGIDIQVFPSNAGGDINGGVDEYVSIPSDGTSYLFNCYENPLPGGWSVVAQSGNNLLLISEAITASLSAFGSPGTVSFTASRHILGFINNSMQATGSTTSGMNSFNSLSNGPLNMVPQYEVTTSLDIPNNSFRVFAHQRPDNPWKKINTIRIVTNISSSLQDEFYFKLLFGMSCEFYQTGTNIEPNYDWDPVGAWPNTNPQWATFRDSILTSWLNTNPGNGNANIGVAAGGVDVIKTSTVIPGTFVAGPDSPYLAANAGDPGTLIFNMNISQVVSSSGMGLTNLGINFIGSFTNSAGTFDVYRVKHWGLNMGHFLNTSLPNVKLIPRYSVTLS